MKPRFVYLLLFAIPGLLLSALLTLLLFGAALGVLWLFVLGDNPWPDTITTLLSVGFGLLFVGMWAAMMVAGYHMGAARERDGGLNTRHILISAGLSLALILLVVLGLGYQAAVQRLTPPSDGARCSEFCSARGYNASSVSPQVSASRTCSCLNGSGAAIIEVPLESLK